MPVEVEIAAPQWKNADIRLQRTGQSFLVSTTNAYKGSRGIAPLILNLGTRWRQVVNQTPTAALSPEKNTGTH